MSPVLHCPQGSRDIRTHHAASTVVYRLSAHSSSLTVLFSTAHEQRLVFKLLNSWNKMKKITLPDVEIVWHSIPSAALLTWSHLHLRVSTHLRVSVFVSQGLSRRVQGRNPMVYKSKLFTIQPLMEKVCWPLVYVICTPALWIVFLRLCWEWRMQTFISSLWAEPPVGASQWVSEWTLPCISLLRLKVISFLSTWFGSWA